LNPSVRDFMHGQLRNNPAYVDDIMAAGYASGDGRGFCD